MIRDTNAVSALAMADAGIIQVLAGRERPQRINERLRVLIEGRNCRLTGT